MNSIRKVSNVTYAPAEISCSSFFWHWGFLFFSLWLQINKVPWLLFQLSASKARHKTNEKSYCWKGMTEQNVNSRKKIWGSADDCRSQLLCRDEHASKFFQQTKVENIFLFFLMFSPINSPLLLCCNSLALMNMNKLSFSLADKYLSKPAKERQFSLTQLITSHLYVFCGWIILSQGSNNIPSHSKQLLRNPTLVLLLCVCVCVL